MSASGTPRNIYHLSDGNALAREITQQLEALGFRIESANSVDALRELSSGTLPHVLLVDASHASDVALVGEVRREALQHASDKSQDIVLIAMAAHDNMQARLEARRAGVETLLVPPFQAAEVVRRLESLLAPAVKDNARILIVEDDR
jgi:CheY-like chemotaxis protein